MIVRPPLLFSVGVSVGSAYSFSTCDQARRREDRDQAARPDIDIRHRTAARPDVELIGRDMRLAEGEGRPAAGADPAEAIGSLPTIRRLLWAKISTDAVA